MKEKHDVISLIVIPELNIIKKKWSKGQNSKESWIAVNLTAAWYSPLDQRNVFLETLFLHGPRLELSIMNFSSEVWKTGVK